MVFKLLYIFFLKKTCVELIFAYGQLLFAKSYAGSEYGLKHSALAQFYMSIFLCTLKNTCCMCLWPFLSFLLVAQKSVNVGYVDSHSSSRSQISRGGELNRWPMLLVCSSLNQGGQEKERGAPLSTHHALIGNSYFLDLQPGNNCKWIPEYLRSILLPKVFTRKKAYTEGELKIGTWKEKKKKVGHLETVPSVR